MSDSLNEDTSCYACYDLRAIQSFIFRVPKLKHIVGGSALVDRFDRNTVPEIVAKEGGRLVYAAGGKGAVRCASAAIADRVEAAIRAEAHRLGLDVRFGRDRDFSAAAHASDRLYPFVPPLVDGHPCALSGLYPVVSEDGTGVHPSVRRRIFDRKEAIFRHFEDRLRSAKPDVGPGLAGRAFRFMTNNEPDEPEGRAGRAALGGSRWAIVCMDGNDMGRQFREASRLAPDALEGWIRHMSRSLDDCALAAARAGIERVARRWSKDRDNPAIDACVVDGEVVIPVRPLVVGGDDIIVICHPAHAFDFVEAAVAAWAETASAKAKDYGTVHGLGLWPATGGTLSISAGVLFCPSTLPVHAAVPYAESLLASAKHLGRSRPRENAPSPASIDWESIVESVLDTPAARRAREMRFRDLDVPEGSEGAVVELTERPYGLDEFLELRRDAAELAEIPRSIRAEILPGLRQGRSDRALFRQRLAKHHPDLGERLDESAGARGSAWTVRGATTSTWIPDALSLLDESDRHARPTELETRHA